jgi:hypothetical protein
MAGVLGPSSAILFGGTVENEERSGGRLSGGFWFDDEQWLGLEGSIFFLGQRSVHFTASSGGDPILARPFFNALTGREDAELVAFPGVLTGGVSVTSSSRFWGDDLNLRSRWWHGPCWHIDVLAGFRHLQLEEGLSITENLAVPAGAPMFAGSTIGVNDSFSAHNNFYGGQLGTELEFRRGRWTLDLLGKVALGATRETIQIRGATVLTTPGSLPAFAMGGLLAQPTNIGNFGRSRFAVVPEAGLKVSYQITSHLRGYVGYSLIAVSDVARPGHQIDRFVNPSQLPTVMGPGTLVGAARPLPLINGADFWAQGISFGFELIY